jgi:uncharacterized damage-inducible protein DinB
MFSVELLRHLYRHMAWADARMWSAVGRLPGGAPDPRLLALLLHMHTVQQAFFSVWSGQPVGFRQEHEFASLEELRVWALPYYQKADAFLHTIQANDLDTPITLPWARRMADRLGEGLHTPTLADTIFQVAHHTTHHRAQVNARLKELAIEPPLVDYIAWIWFGQPRAEG